MKTGRRSAQALVREVVMTLARFHIPGPLVLLALFGGCHGNQPLEPPTDDGPTLSAVSQKGPSGLVANPLPGAIGLGWQDNSPNETGFERSEERRVGKEGRAWGSRETSKERRER